MEVNLEKLKEPLPNQAISPHPTKAYLSTIKAIYVVERLNMVFGTGMWRVENTFIEKVEKMVVVKSVFTFKEMYIEAFGGNDNADLGDAYKGACTDALTKIGSYLGIGMDVFKGLATSGANSVKNTTSNQRTAPDSTTNANTYNNSAEDDNKPWIDDTLFSEAIKKCVDAGTFKIGADPKEVTKMLRIKYKVAKKYEAMVNAEIDKHAIGINV